MPGLRRVHAVYDMRPEEAAVVLSRRPVEDDGGAVTFDEVWLFNANAPIDRIVEECNGVLPLADAQCEQYRTHTGRRSLWLLAAVLAGLLLPSPLRGLYRAQEWLLHTVEAAGYIAVTALLALAWREHRAMRRLTDDR